MATVTVPERVLVLRRGEMSVTVLFKSPLGNPCPKIKIRTEQWSPVVRDARANEQALSQRIYLMRFSVLITNLRLDGQARRASAQG